MMSTVTLRNFLRIFFILFSLYLMGDAFSRWDGFSYYAPFSEFVPSVALAFIMWNIVGMLTAVIIWLIFELIRRASNHARVEIRIEHLLLHAFIFLLLGLAAWKGKKLIWPDLQTTLLIKLAVFLCAVLVSGFLTWLLRDRAGTWIEAVLERITPLVWLFSIVILISVPVVIYHAWFKGADIAKSQKAAGAPGDKAARPNIILLTFDALAAREMSLYGYPKETTPFIRKWADNATVFTMTEASSNFTTPAAASLLTGKRVWTHQTYHIEGTKPLRSNVESLPAVLKDHGYFNIALVVNPFASVRVLGMSGSFDIAPLTSDFGKSASLFGWKFGTIDVMLYRAFGDKIRLHNWILRNDFILGRFLNLISRNITQTEVPPEKAFNTFLKIADADLPRPFFAWVHIFPPHDPYLPPGPFKGMFNRSSELRSYKQQEQLIDESYKYLFQYERLPEEMHPPSDLMRDYYDEFVAYIDKSFDDFIQELDERNLNNTIIVLTADHGESFEHGYLTHGGPFLYEQVTHIPLIIKESGKGTGRRVDPLVEQIDIPATILELADIPVPSWMEGRSLIPLMRGDTLPPRPAFSMNFELNPSRGHQINKGSIAVWQGDYKLIHYLSRGESLLFNLKQDPDERDNMMDRSPEIGSKLLGLIKDNLDTANSRLPEGSAASPVN